MSLTRVKLIFTRAFHENQRSLANGVNTIYSKQRQILIKQTHNPGNTSKHDAKPGQDIPK